VTAGFRELFGAGAVCAVEWPEKAAGALPAADLAIELQVHGEGRAARLAAASDLGVRCLTRVQQEWSTRSAAG
jgi:tRNA threonylcarbamoyladenosine biosynthesis protein TsaE